MSLLATCPNPSCSKSATVPESYAGRGVRCPACGTRFTLPGKSETNSSTSLDSEVPATVEPTDVLPERIGRFVIRARLGAGAFGVVYRAYDAQLEREVAIKVLQESALGHATAADRFLREAQLAAGLQHPHIVPTYDAGREGTRYFIATAFIAGKTLEAVLAEGAVRPRRAAEIARDLASALAYAHGQRVIHRDVKPANVMIDLEDRPVLMDFGLARRHDEASRLTREGTVLGTPAYMSPEQAAGRSADMGPASDQYALGVILYRLLTGRLPFQGPLPQVLADIANKEPPPPRQVAPRTPRDLEIICLKALAKDPRHRYADCQELAEDLQRWLAGERIEARSPTLGRRKHAFAAAAFILVSVSIYYALSRGPEPAIVENRTPPPSSAPNPPPPAKEKQAKLTPTEPPAPPPLPPRPPLIRYRTSIVTSAKELQCCSATHPREPLLATAADGAVTLWQLPGPQAVEKRSFKHERVYIIQRLAFTTENETLQITGYGGQLLLWRRGLEQTQLTEVERARFFSPNGLSLLRVGNNGWWELLHNSKTFTIGDQWYPGTDIRGVAFSPDGRSVAMTGWRPASADSLRGTAYLWSLATGKPIHELSGHPLAALSAAFRPDGKVVATGGQNIVILHDVASGKTLMTLRGLTGFVSAVAFSPDGLSLAAGCDDGSIRVWDLPKPTKIGAADPWTDQGAIEKAIIPGYRQKTFGCIGAGGGLVQAYRQLGHTNEVTEVHFAADGKTLLSTGEDRTVRLWQPATTR